MLFFAVVCVSLGHLAIGYDNGVAVSVHFTNQ
jgi:hypothetical protein